MSTNSNRMQSDQALKENTQSSILSVYLSFKTQTSYKNLLLVTSLS